VIVLAFDGLDYGLTRIFIAADAAVRAARTGGFVPLVTTMPPQSPGPVWSCGAAITAWIPRRFPGVLLSNRRLRTKVTSLEDVSAAILAEYDR
jgi:hypothetical protein